MLLILKVGFEYKRRVMLVIFFVSASLKTKVRIFFVSLYFVQSRLEIGNLVLRQPVPLNTLPDFWRRCVLSGALKWNSTTQPVTFPVTHLCTCTTTALRYDFRNLKVGKIEILCFITNAKEFGNYSL